jgi:UDP-glucose:Glycoprotein Glucosyltransferase
MSHFHLHFLLSGYFQLQAVPGLWTLNLADGRGAFLFNIGECVCVCVCEFLCEGEGGEKEGVCVCKSVYLQIILIPFCSKLLLSSIISHFLFFVLFQFYLFYFIYFRRSDCCSYRNRRKKSRCVYVCVCVCVCMCLYVCMCVCVCVSA